MLLKIGELARAAGVKLTTLRYYERYGLLPLPQRNQVGYRQYSSDMVSRIHFIKKGQELGFSLDEISWMLQASQDTRIDSQVIKSQMAEKIKMLESKIASLIDMKRNLQTIYERCPGEGPIEGCPILKALGSTQI